MDRTTSTTPTATTAATAAATGTLTSPLPDQQRRRLTDEPVAGTDQVPRHQRLDGPAAELASGCDGVLFLHHRLLGRTGRGSVDCIAVGGGGVHVLAFVHGEGTAGRLGRAERREAERALAERVRLLDALLDRQVLATTTALGGVAVPVHGLVCVAGAPRLPEVRTSYPVLDVAALGARLRSGGPFGPDVQARAHAALVAGLPPA